MSCARVKYMCQNAIHLISRFGCVEFGNLMLLLCDLWYQHTQGKELRVLGYSLGCAGKETGFLLCN